MLLRRLIVSMLTLWALGGILDASVRGQYITGEDGLIDATTHSNLIPPGP